MSADDQSLHDKRQRLAQLKLMKERLEAELADEEGELASTSAENEPASASHASSSSNASSSSASATSATADQKRARPASAKSAPAKPSRTKPPRTKPTQTETGKTETGKTETGKTETGKTKANRATQEQKAARATTRAAAPASQSGAVESPEAPANGRARQPARESSAAPRAETLAPPATATRPSRSASSNETSESAAGESSESSETEEQASPALSGKLWRHFRGAPPWLISLIVHMAIVVLLAIATIVSLPPEEKIFALATIDDDTESIDEISEVAIEQLEMQDVQELAIETQMPDPGQIEFGEVNAAEAMQVSEVGNLSMATTIGDIGALFGKNGKGMSELGDGMYAAVSFFGTKSKGRRFVFVVDNSNSMGRGKYETALDEMMKSVSVLGPKQQFYVIFFSDMAYRMFHPKPADRAVPATPKNKENLRIWLYNTEMCLQTKGLEAVQAALALNPDVVFILGDGAFTDKTGAFLTAPHSRRVVINTLGMEVSARGKQELTAIAKANGGTYKDVRTTPAMQEFARKNPIKKNRTRGKVWGLKLPVAKK